MKQWVLLSLLAVSVPCSASAKSESLSAPEGYGKTRGLLGPVVIGPKLSLLRLPTGPTIGLEAKAYERWGAWLDYGFIPKLNVDKYSFEFSSWSVGAKVYPFKGSFFLGAGFGSYNLTATATLTDNNGNPYTGKLTVNPMFVSPRLGWLWSWQSGFFMSLDLNWQFPLGLHSTLAVPAGLSPGSLKDVQDNVDKYAKIGLPNLGLLQVGWFL